MADQVSQYFDAKNPTITAPGEGRLGGPRELDFFTALERIQQAWFVVMDNQLNRSRGYRNRFMRAVR